MYGFLPSHRKQSYSALRYRAELFGCKGCDDVSTFDVVIVVESPPVRKVRHSLVDGTRSKLYTEL